MNIRKYRNLMAIVLGYGILYSLISIVNHYNFRTCALDLGLYTQALYKYAHLKMADSSMIKDYYELLLGAHFDLYLILFSPLIYAFGTYTLLIIQILMVLTGGIGIYKLIEQKDERNKLMPVWAVLYFYSFFGILSALSFDYHSVVVASCIVPWFFFTLDGKRYQLSAVLFFIILIAQENISLWMIFVCIGLLIQYRRDVKTVRFLSLLLSLSTIYFIVVFQFLIPCFSESHKYQGFQYSLALGNSPLEAIKSLLFNPIDNFKILFTNHTNNLHGDFVKVEFHVFILLSGICLLLLKPSYLIMLIPLYVQKLFHDNYFMWGFSGQYVAEFAPVLAVGIFSVLLQIKNKRTGIFILTLLFIGTATATIRMMDNTINFTDKARIRFYQSSHYNRVYDVMSVHDQLNQIPKKSRISALSPFVPHLALRDNIYQFPLIKDADFIVYSAVENPYPMGQNDFNSLIFTLENSGDWIIKYKNDGFTILKKSGYKQDCMGHTIPGSR